MAERNALQMQLSRCWSLIHDLHRFCNDVKKKEKEENYRKSFIFFCQYISFFPKIQEIRTIFFLLDMHHIFLKKILVSATLQRWRRKPTKKCRKINSDHRNDISIGFSRTFLFFRTQKNWRKYFFSADLHDKHIFSFFLNWF